MAVLSAAAAFRADRSRLCRKTQEILEYER